MAVQTLIFARFPEQALSPGSMRVNRPAHIWLMKWKNAAKDYLPPSSTTVLISLNGVYHIAMYDDKKQVFRVRDAPEDLEISAVDSRIYWTEIENSK